MIAWLPEQIRNDIGAVIVESISHCSSEASRDGISSIGRDMDRRGDQPLLALRISCCTSAGMATTSSKRVCSDSVWLFGSMGGLSNCANTKNRLKLFRAPPSTHTHKPPHASQTLQQKRVDAAAAALPAPRHSSVNPMPSKLAAPVASGEQQYVQDHCDI